MLESLRYFLKITLFLLLGKERVNKNQQATNRLWAQKTFK